MTKSITIDDKEWNFSYTYDFLVCFFKEVQAHQTGVRAKHIEKDTLEGAELEAFKYLAADLPHVNLTENAIHIALVNSKWIVEHPVYSESRERRYGDLIVSTAIQSAIRRTTKNNPRIFFRANDQIKQERKKNA